MTSIAQRVANHHSDLTVANGYYIGIMSGTSMDAIDAVLVSFNDKNRPSIASHVSIPFPETLKLDLSRLIQPGWSGSLRHIASLNAKLGTLYGKTANTLIQQSGIPKHSIHAIGNHGQTIWHQPDDEPHFSWQLGDANRIAELTGVATIADFRNRDIAAGGEGAPLVPAFHEAIFPHPSKTRIVLNIGGIANISLLTPTQNTLGFDTGPGNALLDAWCLDQQGLPFDEDGDWAAQGKIRPDLLQALIQDPYFKRPCPKSTGKESFNLPWAQPHLTTDMAPADVQATFLEITALSIADGVKLATRSTNTTLDEVYVCGGGSKNLTLMKRLAQLLSPAIVTKTDELGVDADWVEAIAFAWLARQTMLGLPSNLPSATGAKGLRVLGAIYPGNDT
ncbi:MAG: anhydro-N-acetylmuramic acid kinase [Leucothrix sp.]